MILWIQPVLAINDDLHRVSKVDAAFLGSSHVVLLDDHVASVQLDRFLRLKTELDRTGVSRCVLLVGDLRGTWLDRWLWLVCDLGLRADEVSLATDSLDSLVEVLA